MVCSLESLPSYNALSYMWGTGPKHRILCDGKSLGVHENLRSALRQLRDVTSTRILWVDAVCINQDDEGKDGEKGSQIQQMRAIYERAEKVVVWLGDSSETSSIGFEVLEAIASAADSEIYAKEPKPIKSEDLKLLGLPERASPRWRALGALFWREWFTRIWVIQEIGVASSVVICCGNDQTPWSNMASAAKFILNHSLDSLTDVDPTRVIKLESYRGRDISKRHLLPLLCEARSSFATNDRDKIYAILGLASGVDGLGLKPDYTKDVSVVYTELAKSFIERDRNLDILSAVENHRYRLRTRLPFWVPDWEAHPPSSPFSTHRDFTSMRASGNSDSLCRFEHHAKCLVARGRVIDSVHYLGDAFEEFIPLAGTISQGDSAVYKAQAMTRPRQWERMAWKLKSYPTGEHVKEAFTRTLIGQVKPEPGISPAELPLYYDDWRRYWMVASRNHSKYIQLAHTTMSSSEIARATYIMKGQQQAAYGRRFITTKNGYMGLTPPLARIGDKIVILLGGRTPFILRKTGREEYRFVGECYIHGMMTGEGLKEEKMQDFSIW